MKNDKTVVRVNFSITNNIKNNITKKTTNLKHLFKFLGPAFIVSVAYVDPGNFATNISGGSIFNYSLVWVILWSNLMAIFAMYVCKIRNSNWI